MLRAIKILNAIAVLTPLVILLLGLIGEEELLIFVLVSLIFTGFVQVILGFILLIKYPQNRHFQIYIGGVVLYFVIWFLGDEFNLSDNSYRFLIIFIPLALAIYLTVLISNLSD